MLDNESNPEDEGRTTFDVTEDAEEALRRFQEEQAKEKQDAPSIPKIEGALNLRIEIEDAATPLVLKLTGKAIIGRRDPAAEITPELDLTPYGGYQMGISRRHAILRLESGRLELIDLGSRNGTYVDGKRLAPHQPAILKDDTEVRLGKIVMKLHFQ